jgi:hypothetical protein
MCIGTAIGLVRGSRAAALRFLAENAHRPPTTVRGWYFYNKTKNYKMMLGGLSKAGTDAAKLGFTALAWVTFEEGLNHVGWGDIGEIGAGIGTAGVFAGVCKWRHSLRTDNVLKIKSRSASMENGVSGGNLRHVCWSYNADDTVGETATGRRSSGAK